MGLAGSWMGICRFSINDRRDGAERIAFEAVVHEEEGFPLLATLRLLFGFFDQLTSSGANLGIGVFDLFVGREGLNGLFVGTTGPQQQPRSHKVRREAARHRDLLRE